LECDAYEYDPRNQVTKTIDQGPDGDITAPTDNLTATQWYDALGRVTQTQDPAGQQTAYLFDKLGQLTRTTEDVSGQNSIGRHTDRAYDRANRLTRLTAYSNSAGGTGVQNTDYAYNKSGQLTKTTYPDAGSVSLYVDAANRVTRARKRDRYGFVGMCESGAGNGGGGVDGMGGEETGFADPSKTVPVPLSFLLVPLSCSSCWCARVLA